MTPSTMSRWLISTIKRVYDAVDRPEVCRAHEIRALATSFARLNSVPFSDIMQAATWRSESTFARHFYRSLARAAPYLHQLGPLAVAQHILH